MARIFLSKQVPGGSYHECEQVGCIRCGRDHDKVWMVTRRIKPWGHFATAVINKRNERGQFGRSEVIDASLPHVVFLIPKDAIAATPEEAAGFWHDDNESHVFGGPNVAKALREAIKASNEGAAR